MTELAELEALGDAVRDTQICAGAVVSLRDELAALGCQVSVDWRAVADAQRQVEIAYLKVFEAVKLRAMETLK